MIENNTVVYKIIGETIKQKRIHKRLSQDELAAVVGIARSSLSNIESGKHQVPIATLYRIAQELNTEVQFIIPSISEVKKRKDLSKRHSRDLNFFLRKQTISKDERKSISSIINSL